MESVEAMVQDKAKEAMKEAQASLLGAFDQLMSAKLDSVQNKISDNQQKLSESQIAKIQSNILTNDGYKFKKKSCEDQFKFGIKLMDSLQDAGSALSRNNDPASLAAKEKISEGDYFQPILYVLTCMFVSLEYFQYGSCPV